MMIRRKLITAVSAITLMVTATFTVAETQMYIPLVSKGFQHQFWQAVKAGADQAAEEFDVRITFEGPDSEAMVDRQIDMLSAALANKPSAIGFAALDSQAAIPLLRKASQAGIPIIAFDSGVASDIPLTTATTDNVAAAALAADEMAKLIGNKGKVAIVAHDQTSQTGIDRRDGFMKRIESAHPGISIVSVQYGQGDQLKSTEIAKAILTANPDLDGMFGTNEGSAIGLVNAVREMNNSSVVIIGYDSGKAQKDAVRSGLMAGAITQNPVGIGYETVKAAVMASQGKTLPKIIDTGFYYYTAANMDDAEIAAVLYD
ncbi:MAG: ABC transporter substrate-binding protein [Reinekea forsetii]|jgi:ribose transport system substrate-binding protein|uniref:Ribose ABC transport system, substrate binding protein unit n=1 Tax=Reinekea forsetii TaxID=1336806 RepID=A0A2K8KM50_9GAMM|nr:MULTISPECIES: ABC transporter substrate-binding protein [Reinekea]ATX75915.1 ribose ABC transport system, substrate binding protein unit [Reinekea forsetii]MDO7642605.1 ABC transporter substrate-binding protein [Reinekea forsetii]MDO7644770.1 ABC transporter substrate-binding protein [Reinekea forsetii]MDO7673182.1 ABC transporter substrate-binding protein [Reinekea forsetii]